MLRCFAGLLLALVLLGCTAPAGAPTSGAASDPREVQRPLVVAGGREPESLGSKPLRQLGGAGLPRTALRAFNAGLVLNDAQALPHPYLAEALPALNTDSWKLNSDGTMETTYHLRPALAWHDGASLTADDFVFAREVYATPELGVSASAPIVYIQEVVAPDERTVVVRWKQAYADAANLQASDLPPLPRHILDEPLRRHDPDAFAALPFWTTEYVGAGPYRLTRWERGGFIEAEGFAAHAGNAPRIDHLRLMFMNDSNAVIAALLSGAVDLATNDSLDVDQAFALERQWAASEGGTVLRSPVGVRYAALQLRPAYATPPALLDPQVRRGIAYAIDRDALAAALSDGSEAVADTMLLPRVEYFDQVKAAIVVYPHDPSANERLMNQIGWRKDSEGQYRSGGARFGLEIAVAAGGRNDNEVAIMADTLRRAGYDTSIRVIPREQITDLQM
ncbi:MAG TPA: ABC transporter substrate-binding protein, partial [Chloroflexota bacterium]